MNMHICCNVEAERLGIDQSCVSSDRSRIFKLVNARFDAGARHTNQVRNLLDGPAAIFAKCGDY